MPQPNDFVNPYDGFRAEVAADGTGGTALWLTLRGGGESQLVVPVDQTHAPDLLDGSRATRDRAFFLLQALARFLNAGGDLLGVGQLVAYLYRQTGDFAVQFPDNWSLLTCLYDVDDPTLVLVNDTTGKAMVIKEDLYCETVNLEELAALIEEVPRRDTRETTDTGVQHPADFAEEADTD